MAQPTSRRDFSGFEKVRNGLAAVPPPPKPSPAAPGDKTGAAPEEQLPQKNPAAAAVPAVRALPSTPAPETEPSSATSTREDASTTSRGRGETAGEDTGPAPSARAVDDAHRPTRRSKSARSGSRSDRAGAATETGTGPATVSGPAVRVWARDRQGEQAAMRHLEALRRVLDGKVDYEPLSSRLEDETFTARLRTSAPQAVLDLLPDLVTEFGTEDISADLAGGEVTLSIPVPAADKARQHAVYVPAELRDAVKEHVSRMGESITTWTLKAFNTHHARFADWFGADDVPAGPMEVTEPRRRRTDAGPLVQLWLNLRPAQLQVLDEAVQASGARSRSEFVTVLLQKSLASDPF